MEDRQSGSKERKRSRTRSKSGEASNRGKSKEGSRDRGREESGPNKQVYIGHLPYDVRRSELMEMFESYGKILECQVKRRFAFMTFETVEGAQAAIDGKNDYNFQGENI